MDKFLVNAFLGYQVKFVVSAAFLDSSLSEQNHFLVQMEGGPEQYQLANSRVALLCLSHKVVSGGLETRTNQTSSVLVTWDLFASLFVAMDLFCKEHQRQGV